jgi:sugar/nucleoside kinase (ribokinase family)
MPSKFVVVGVTSLYMSVGVEEFPLRYAPTSKPVWMRAGVTGSAGHIAKILRALGDEIRLCTLASHDPVGQMVRADLSSQGLLGRGVLDRGSCSLGVVLVAPDGSRMGFPYLAGVSAIEYPVEVFHREAAGADLAVMTNARFVRPLIPLARQQGVPVAVDVHLISTIDDDYNRPWLEVADIVFCSHERLTCAPAEWIAQVFARYPGCQMVGVGSGPAGCLLGLRDGTLVQVAGLAPRGVVSTAGAGDSLFASFLHGWLATGNPVRALEAAVLYAGWKVGDTFPAASSLSEAELSGLQTLHRARTSIGRWRSAQGLARRPDPKAAREVAMPEGDRA